MKRAVKKLLPGLLAPLLWAGTQAVQAQTEAHVHGQARLDVVVDGTQLLLMLEAPLDSVVGFEHRPRTPAQRQTADAALKALADGARLFRPVAAAGCRWQSGQVSAPVLQAAAGPLPADAAGEHADLDARFAFRCETPARLQAIDIGLFEALPRLKRLEVQFAGPATQGRQILSPGAARLVLAR